MKQGGFLVRSLNIMDPPPHVLYEATYLNSDTCLTWFVLGRSITMTLRCPSQCELRAVDLFSVCQTTSGDQSEREEHCFLLSAHDTSRLLSLHQWSTCVWTTCSVTDREDLQDQVWAVVLHEATSWRTKTSTSHWHPVTELHHLHSVSYSSLHQCRHSL